MTASQRFSVRATISAGTTPSGNGRCRKSGCVSANVASRQEQEEVEGEPPHEQEQHRRGGDKERPTRTVLQGFQCSVSIDGLSDVFWRCSGRVVPVGGKFGHRLTYHFWAETAGARACW